MTAGSEYNDWKKRLAILHRFPILELDLSRLDHKEYLQVAQLLMKFVREAPFDEVMYNQAFLQLFVVATILYENRHALKKVDKYAEFHEKMVELTISYTKHSDELNEELRCVKQKYTIM